MYTEHKASVPILLSVALLFSTALNSYVLRFSWCKKKSIPNLLFIALQISDLCIGLLISGLHYNILHHYRRADYGKHVMR